MATIESTINDALAVVLRKTRRAWGTHGIISSENTGMLKGSNKRPDILVTEANVSPVIIETEVLPAVTVETEAISRLGEQIRTTGNPILSSVAVRLPQRLRDLSGSHLEEDLAGANDIEMALYTGSNSLEFTRWPGTGWLVGNVSDMSILTQSASVPPDVINEAADQLISGVSESAGILQDIAQTHPAAVHKISVELHQQDGDQTRRMAMTILANAFIFHDTLAGGTAALAAVKSLDELSGSESGLTKSNVLAEWQKILKVNYWPIFDIARRILQVMPPASSKLLVERLAATAARLLQNRLMRSHDLTGAVFQRLIIDRKFLAAFYTTPASAALLVGLAITPEKMPSGGNWSAADDVKALRFADFACGTGTLLSTAYQRIGQLHEIAGGNAEAIHPAMMANAITGCDVLPAAAHLTASMLAGAHPTVVYNRSSIITVAYGQQPDGGIALGSLDLISPQGKLEIVPVTAKYMEGMGGNVKETWLSLPHASYDLIIMNPPFTRATGHEGNKIGVPNPMFAAFSSSKELQRLMSKVTSKLTKGTSAHGNAGEASIFLVLGDHKLKIGGVLALVMPLSLMSGEAWEDSRMLLMANYTNIILVSISGSDGADFSFSADTHMGECLVIAEKSNTKSSRAVFVVLEKRPPYPMVGATAARQIHQLIAAGKLRRLEDGPLGGTAIRFGGDVIGQIIDAPLPASGGWNLSRIADLSLAQTAYQIADRRKIWLPTMGQKDVCDISVATVAEIGNIGPYHSDINGRTATGGARGPFDVSDLKAGTVPTYPVLWAHDAGAQKAMQFEADSEGTARIGSSAKEQASIDTKLTSVWGSASHCHISREFQFNSQSTSMQFTSRRSIGGRAWLSIAMASADQEKALVLWSNTSFGLLLHWWHANKQQAGRGNIGKVSLESMPVLDVTALTPEQMKKAVCLFNAMSTKDLLPVNEIDKDTVRKELDTRFAQEVLGLPSTITADGGPLELLRMKLAQEPSIRGQK